MQGDASCPSDCFKGTSQARVPISYALQYCMNLEYKKEWDDVFNEGSTFLFFNFLFVLSISIKQCVLGTCSVWTIKSTAIFFNKDGKI